MNKMSYIKLSIITAVCIALCVVLPMAFHAIPDAGIIYSPMHIPVLLCGLICGWQFGLLCGLTGPLLSSLIAGMPPMAYLPPMLIELAIYGLIAGAMMLLIHTKKHYIDIYISLITAMLIGRVIAGAAKALIFTAGKYSIETWTASYFITCWPGIIIQLALIPAIIFALEKARLIPSRYPKQI
ncbi:MAG: ECF transporter S component [Oscillospiraceae bacterium]|nr:ECF transporter S component [Oscillospiraceae bacterium]